MLTLLLPNLRQVALVTVVAGILFDMSPARAGDVAPGQTRTIDGQNLPENWTVQDRAALYVINGSNIGGVLATHGYVSLSGSSAISATSRAGIQGTNGTTLDIRDSLVSATANGSAGIILSSSGGTPGFGEVTQATVARSNISGSALGASLSANSMLDVSASQVTGTAAGSAGVGIFSGTATFSGRSVVSGQANGVQIMATSVPGIVDAGRYLIVDDSTVSGVEGSGILVSSRMPSAPTSANITLRNGAQVSGGNGTAIELDERTTAVIDSDASQILGDVRVADGSNATLALRNGSTMQGAASGDIAATIDASTWNVTGDSNVTSLTMNGGQIAFVPRGDAHSTLSVANNFAGNGGTVTMNVNVDAVGPVAQQATDRLLIGGDVTGTTYLDIVPTGKGTSTDRNGNAIIDPSEGILLVGVGGNAASDSFKLAKPLTVGGFDYELLARNGSEIDPSRNPFPSGPLNWEYSLVTPTCTRDGCTPVEPEPPVEPKPPVDPEPPVKPPVERPKLAEQVPSYLLAGAAIQSYNSLFGGWRQREGNVADGSADASSGGYAFARYVGGQYDYSSNRSFQNYGFDAHWLMNAFQVGGGLFDWAGNRGTLRAGWALDHGTLRISPHAVDGDSSTRFTANGIGMWLNWQGDNGLWVDGVLTGRRFTGDVGTDTQGKDVARIHASSWVASVEVGKTFMAGDWAIEPHAQLTRQQVSFRDFQDQDGLDVSLGSGTQTSARVGVLVRRAIDEKFIPYVRTDFTYTVSGTPTATLSSEDWNVSNTFGTGRTGHSVLVAAGATSQLTRNVQLYGEGNYQHQLGGYGVRGWSGNIGVRVSF